MLDVAKVILIGRVGKDPEVKMVDTKKGSQRLATISVATSHGPKDNRVTDWHDISFWDKTAELAEKYLHRGNLVYLEGTLSYNKVGEGAETKVYAQISSNNFINLTGKPESTDSVATSTPTSGMVEDVNF